MATLFQAEQDQWTGPEYLHVLNLGMGVESVAILTRWIYEPETRPFRSWEEVLVLTAQTGDEYGSTKQLMEQFMLPLMRSLGIRYVQVSRASAKDADGITVLSDTTEPWVCHTEGDWSMGEAMELDGWVVRLNRPHTCAIRFKGWVLDTWLKANIPNGVRIGPYIGYNCDEMSRVKDAQDYGCLGEEYLFPLVEWQWTRQACLDYLEAKFGVLWEKSCCDHCPFQGERAIARWEREPEHGAKALWREYLAMAFNGRMFMFGDSPKKMAKNMAEAAGLTSVLDLFHERLKTSDWAVYRVRRVYQKYGKMVNADRCIEQVARGSYAAMLDRLLQLGPAEDDNGHWRVSTHLREPGVFPAVEGFYVLAPAVMREKVRNEASFEKKWRSLTEEDPQLELFAGMLSQ